MSIIGRTSRMAVSLAAIGLAVAGGVATAGPAGAVTPAVRTATAQVVTPHVASCDGFGSNSFSWWANCRVTSGHSRAMAACGDGNVHPGSWVGVGYWRFGIDCYPYAMQSWWIEDGS
ncbi:hypothetical protein [Kitasatospora sp. McL0602]|uniref:hypothetical protein n=1 Tax=Kitasatospora sp. McL0602 TaxID=3439530 RepID=UPI003F8CA4CA